MGIKARCAAEITSKTSLFLTYCFGLRLLSKPKLNSDDYGEVGVDEFFELLINGGSGMKPKEHVSHSSPLRVHQDSTYPITLAA